MKDTVPKNPGPKWIEYDSSLPKGTIKGSFPTPRILGLGIRIAHIYAVLSRTLFVGGVT